jgi:hypothetical protein
MLAPVYLFPCWPSFQNYTLLSDFRTKLYVLFTAIVSATIALSHLACHLATMITGCTGKTTNYEVPMGNRWGRGELISAFCSKERHLCVRGSGLQTPSSDSCEQKRKLHRSFFGRFLASAFVNGTSSTLDVLVAMSWHVRQQNGKYASVAFTIAAPCEKHASQRRTPNHSSKLYFQTTSSRMLHPQTVQQMLMKRTTIKLETKRQHWETSQNLKQYPGTAYSQPAFPYRLEASCMRFACKWFHDISTK